MTGSSDPPPEVIRRLDGRPLVVEHRFAVGIATALWAVAGLLFLALAVPGLSDAVERVDEWVHAFVVDAETSALVTAAEILDVLGGSWVTWPIIAVVGAFLIVRKRWEALWFWISAMAASQVLIGPIKALYGRARPPLALVATSGDSFPSGHSVAGAAIAVGLVIVLIPAGPRRRAFEVAAVAVALAMAMSRVYLRAHWLSDVVAGAALGAAISIGVAVAVHRVDERRRSGAASEQPSGGG